MVSNNDASGTSVSSPIKTDLDLENDIVRYLIEKIQSDHFDIKDLGFQALSLHFQMNSGTSQKRLRNILLTLEGNRLLKRKSGLEIYIPSEVVNHPNIKEVKPIRFDTIIIQFIIGFVILIFLTQIPIIGNFLVGFYTNQSIIPIIALSSAIGFFLPYFIGYYIFQIYYYISSNKLLTSYRLLFQSLISIGFCIFLYFLLIYVFNIIYKTNNLPTPEGILVAMGVGVAILAIPKISKLFKRSDNNESNGGE
jgi:hypothetical protein